MQFRLTYNGDLRPNGAAKHKHEIRCAFHKQLKNLWHQAPLNEFLKKNESGEDIYHNEIIKDLKGMQFIPLVTRKKKLFADLNVLLLRSRNVGQAVLDQGDIDNKLKTLFDALKMPSINDISSLNLTEADIEQPFYCLLEDDGMITRVAAESDRFLDARDDNDSLVVVTVKIWAIEVTLGNMGLIG